MKRIFILALLVMFMTAPVHAKKFGDVTVNAGGTLIIPRGTTLPATCTQGSTFHKTDATSGLQVYLCETTNNWVAQGAGGGGGDVSSSANITDHSIVRGDGGAKGVQESGWLISDGNNMSLADSYAGLLGIYVENTFAGAAVAAGAYIQVKNDDGHYGSVGMTNTGSTVGGGAFIDTLHLYNQGYGDTLFTIDGNEDFVWYSDPADNHNYTALTNEIMKLTAAGVLTVGGIEVETAKQQLITVAKAGGDYTSIQSAIDSITDNATDKRYTVLVYPGTYTENVVMEEYVSLVGFDHETTEITSTSGTTVTAPPGTSDAAIANLKLTSVPIADNAIVLLMTTGELDIYGSYLKQTSVTNGVEGKLIDHNGGELKMEHCDLKYDFDGSAAASVQQHNVIDILASSSTDFTMQDCDYFVDVADVDDTIKGINTVHAAGENIEIHLTSNRFEFTMSGAYTGISAWLYSLADTTEFHLLGNSLALESANAGTAYGILINSDGGATFHSTSNHIHVESFGSNYGISIAAGDTFASHFDDVVAADGNTGAGTIIAVQSPADGDFLVTGDVDVEGNLEGATLTESGNAVPNVTDNISVFADVNSSTATAGNLLVANGTSFDSVALSSIGDRSMTCDADGCDVDAETYVFKAKIAFEDPVATDDFFFGEIATNATATSIYCKTLVGTVDLDVQIGGTDINGSDITCTTSGVLDSSLGGDTDLDVGEELKLAIESVASSPTYLMVIVNGTNDD